MFYLAAIYGLKVFLKFTQTNTQRPTIRDYIKNTKNIVYRPQRIYVLR